MMLRSPGKQVIPTACSHQRTHLGPNLTTGPLLCSAGLALDHLDQLKGQHQGHRSVALASSSTHCNIHLAVPAAANTTMKFVQRIAQRLALSVFFSLISHHFKVTSNTKMDYQRKEIINNNNYCAFFTM